MPTKPHISGCARELANALRQCVREMDGMTGLIHHDYQDDPDNMQSVIDWDNAVENARGLLNRIGA